MGERAVLIGVTVAFLVATWTAWSVEISWLIGWTQFEELSDAQQQLVGPSPFLITPFALIGGMLASLMASLVFPNASLERARRQSWRAVMKRSEGGGL